MSELFDLRRDTHGRWRTQLSKNVSCGIRLLPEDHQRRVAKNVRAYAVLDITVPDLLIPVAEGEEPLPVTFRIRDIEIVHKPEAERFLVRYKQWKTGKWRDGAPEYLDIGGPGDRESRYFLQDMILAIFQQILAEASEGTLGRRRDQTSEALGQRPEVRERLEKLAEVLDAAEDQITKPEASEEEESEPQEASA